MLVRATFLCVFLFFFWSQHTSAYPVALKSQMLQLQMQPEKTIGEHQAVMLLQGILGSPAESERSSLPPKRKGQESRPLRVMDLSDIKFVEEAVNRYESLYGRHAPTAFKEWARQRLNKEVGDQPV
jgi:hypothetical protein